MRILIIALIVLAFSFFMITVISSCMENALYQKKHWWTFLFSEFWEDFKLIVKSIFHKPYKSNQIKRLKNLQQIGLVLLEVFTVCGLFLILAQWLSPVNTNNLKQFLYEQVIRFLTFYTAYQFLVFSMLSLTSSARKDSWLAVVRIVKLTKLYLKTLDPKIKDELDFRIKDALFPLTFMTQDARKIVKEIKELLEEGQSKDLVPEKVKADLDYFEIIATHYLEASSLFWHFSLLLNAIKPQGGAER